MLALCGGAVRGGRPWLARRAAATWPVPSSAIHSGIEHNIGIDLQQAQKVDRKTKIVATVAPSSLPRVPELLNCGMNVMRLNCSHGTHAFFSEAISLLRKEVHKARVRGVDFRDGALEDVCGVALDTKGPEIRTGIVESDSGSLLLERGEEVTLVTDEALRDKCSKECIFVDHPGMPALLRPDNTVFMDDGLLALRVVKASDQEVKCVVENGGSLGSRKGVNLPGVAVDLPSVSKRDEADLQFARDNKVDFVFASFVRKAQHVHEIREIVGPSVQVVSKIENQQGLDNYDEILEASDGIMVARGDLGIEIPAERVFLAQKLLVAKANLAGKPVICATQMLESMCHNPRPTRAECVDVANAVLDGSDAVMLSGETATGKFPLEALRFMSATCKAAEAAVNHRSIFDAMHKLGRSSSSREALATAAVHAAFESSAAMLVVVTQTGSSARLIAKYRPEVPLLAMTPNEATARSLQLVRGVHSLLVPADASVDVIMEHACVAGSSMGVTEPGQLYVLVHGQMGMPMAGDTNTVRVMKVE